MSRTDKTCPWNVRALTNPTAYLTELHHHESGPCTLPELTLANLDARLYGYYAGGTRGCGWAYTIEFLLGRDSGCPCPRCGTSHTRKADRRRSRHTWHQREERLAAGRDAPDDLFDGVLADTDSYDVRFAALGAAIGRTLDLPEGSVVVDVEDNYARGTAGWPEDDHELVSAEVMHSDGTREHFELPAGVWKAHTFSQLLDLYTVI